MAQYKLTLLGKTVVLVLTFVVVMLIVTISTFSYDEKKPQETQSLENQSHTSGQPYPATEPPAQTPAPPAPNNTVTPTATPAVTNPPLSSMPPSYNTVPSPPQLSEDELLRERTIVYFEKSSSALDDDALNEISYFISLPENIADYIIVISGNTSSDEGADSYERQTLSRERALSVMEYLKGIGLSEKYMTIVINGAAKEIKSEDPSALDLSRNAELSYIINMK